MSSTAQFRPYLGGSTALAVVTVGGFVMRGPTITQLFSVLGLVVIAVGSVLLLQRRSDDRLASLAPPGQFCGWVQWPVEELRRHPASSDASDGNRRRLKSSRGVVVGALVVDGASMTFQPREDATRAGFEPFSVPLSSVASCERLGRPKFGLMHLIRISTRDGCSLSGLVNRPEALSVALRSVDQRRREIGSNLDSGYLNPDS